MSRISFKRIAKDEARICQDGEMIGDLFRRPDILNGGMVFITHLNEDPHGFRRIHDRARNRETVERLVDTHPYW